VDEIVDSPALAFENQQNPAPARRNEASRLRGYASVWCDATQAIRERGAELEQLGHGPLDAAHLAFAEAAEAEYFLTTDDRLIRRWRRSREPASITVMNPIDYLREIVAP